MGFQYEPSVIIDAREHLIEQLKQRDTKLTLRGAERIADWLIGSDLMGPKFYAQFIDEPDLSVMAVSRPFFPGPERHFDPPVPAMPVTHEDAIEDPR